MAVGVRDKACGTLGITRILSPKSFPTIALPPSVFLRETVSLSLRHWTTPRRASISLSDAYIALPVSPDRSQETPCDFGQPTALKKDKRAHVLSMGRARMRRLDQ